MPITIETPDSSALQSITIGQDGAEVVFAKGGKYTYALQLAARGLYSTPEDVAQSIQQAPSAGRQFNQLLRDGVLMPIA
jgi:hypothetical protein